MRRGEVTRNDLRRRCRRLLPDVYIHAAAPVTAMTRARAASIWAGPGAVLTGVTAAAVLGTKWLDEHAPVELTRSDRHCPTGIVARSYCPAPEDICTRRGLQVTTPARTAFDIGRMEPFDRAVPILDTLMRATGVTREDVLALADARPGTARLPRLRTALEHTDPGAESPPETTLRLLLTASGLPRPETQIEFFDEYGESFIRVDMGWRRWKVAVEYDGIQHWNNARQRAWDIERIAILEAMGWVVIRVSAEMLRRPEAMLQRVRGALRGRGCRL
jgi:hypothetical protein